MNKRTYIVRDNRPRFLKAEPIGRQVDFEGLEAIDIMKFGKKVQLGDKTLDQLLNVKVKDEEDTTYEQEGRPQREKIIQVNFGETAMSLGNEMRAIKQAIESNVDASKEGLASLTTAVLNVMERPNVPQTLDSEQYNTLLAALQRMNIPSGSNYEKTGTFKKRFYSYDEYKNSKALFNIFLMSNRPTKKPILSFDNNGKYKGEENLEYLAQKWPKEDASKQVRMLDIETGALVPLSFVQNVAERNKAEILENDDDASIASASTIFSRPGQVLARKPKSSASTATSFGKAPASIATLDDEDEEPTKYKSRLIRIPKGAVQISEEEARRKMAGPSGLPPPPPPGPAPNLTASRKGKEKVGEVPSTTGQPRINLMAELAKGMKLKSVGDVSKSERDMTPQEKIAAELSKGVRTLRKAPPRQAPKREETDTDRFMAELAAKAAARAAKGTTGSGLTKKEKALLMKHMNSLKRSKGGSIKPSVSEVGVVHPTWRPRYNLW